MTVDELKIIISAQTKDFNSKIGKVNRQLAQVKQSIDASKKGMERLSNGMAKIKTGAAVAAITAVVFAVKKLTGAYSQMQASEMGLESILEAQGKSIGAAKDWLQEYTKDGLIPLTEAYTAYKLLASAGYDDKQTQSVMQNLKDSAAFGRQGSLSMGEAVRSAAEGIKNENSILVDNAGVTKNLSVIWKEYAESVGKGVQSLTSEEKRLATVQGLMRETAFQTGDAAKYASTLAGAQAALRAQTQQLSGALGSIFAPVLQKLLPYLTATAEKLTALATRAGQVMAILFGIKTQTNPVQKVADSAHNAASGLNTVKKKASELKKSLMGFDELNILSEPMSGKPDSNGNQTMTAGSSKLDSALSNANNVIDPQIAKRAEEIRAKLNVLKQKIAEFSPLIKGVSAVGITAFGIGKINKWMGLAKKAVGKSPVLTAGVNALRKALATSYVTFKLGKNPLKALGAGFQSLWGSLKNFLGNLSPFAKMGVSLAALTGQFVVVKNSIEEYKKGNISLGQAMLQIIPTCAAVGAAMYGMLGPWGLVATAVVGVGAAIYGVIKAESELRAEALNAEFYNGVGVKISDVAASFGALTDAVIKANQPILDNQAKIEESKQSITAASQEIDTLISGISRGTVTTKEALPQIEEQFKSLRDNTKTVLDNIYDNISRALAGSIGDTLVKMGVSIPEVSKMINGIVSDTKNELSALEEKAKGVQEQLNSGKGNQTELYRQLADLKTQIANLTLESDPKLSAFQSSIDQINLDNLDFESPEKFAEALSSMSSKASEAKDSIANTNQALIDHFETLKRNVKDAGQIQYLDTIISGIRQDTIDKQNEIDQQMKQTAEAIQKSFYTHFEQIAKKTAPTSWEKFMSYFTGVDVRGLVEDSVLKNFSGLDKSFKETFGKYGDYSMQGYAEGIRDKARIAEAEARTTADKIEKSFHNSSLQFGSPSKKFALYGKWSIEGYAGGMSSNQKLAVNALKGLSNTLENQAKSVFSFDKFKQIGTTAAEGLVSAFKDLKFPKIKVPHFEMKYDTWGDDAKPWKDMGMEGRPKVSVNWYAQGGIFNKPSIIGVGEAGREAVVPLERNTGWIDSMAQKISERINPAAQAAPARPEQPLKITIQLRDTEMASWMITNINALQNKAGGLLLRI